MKILIYGAGVIGSIFAAKLSLSGQDVTVLARGKRLEELRRSGVVLRNPRTGKTETARVNTIETLLPLMRFDYIFVVMKKTQVDAVLEALSRNCTQNIVFIVNTAAGYENWENALGENRLMICFPAAGGNRRDGIVNYFVFHGPKRLFQTTTLGEANGKRTQRIAEVIRMFRRAGIPSMFYPDMDAWQKTHVAMVTCIANALYGQNCDNRKLAASRGDLMDLILAVREGFAVLKKLGIKRSPWKLSAFYLPTGFLTAAFRAIMGTQFAEFTMAMHCVAARDEMIFLQMEFDRLIAASKHSTPHIDRIKQNLALNPEQ